MTPIIDAAWHEIEIPQDGKMEAYLSKPEGEGPWSPVLVFMEIFGINDHIREVTDRIAAEGYVALAINYYHRTTKNIPLNYTEEDVALGRHHKDKTTQEGLLTDVKAALDYLRTLPYVSKSLEKKLSVRAIGFCFGGHVAFLAATLPEIKATAAFYAGGVATMTPGGGPATVTLASKIQGKIICFFGGLDTLIPLSDVHTIEQQLHAANISHEVVLYPQASHGFFCNQRSDYDPRAAADAWERVKTLFKS